MSVVSVVPSRPFALDPAVPYRELRRPDLPDSLRALALDCFAAQRAAGAEHHEKKNAGATPVPGNAATGPNFPDAVSDATLERILADGRSIGGIVTHRELATAVPFNVRYTADVVFDPEVAARRRRLELELTRWIRTLFPAGLRLVLSPAGHWWYPPGTYFGWHTNQGYPGWRLYLTHAEEPGRSYFRYRDPQQGTIETSVDTSWDMRLFEIGEQRHLWHAIYSETHRFSVGWYVRPWSMRTAAKAHAKRILGR